MSYASFYKQAYNFVLFKKMEDVLVCNVDVSFWEWRKLFINFFRPNDVDLDVLHDQIKLNSEVESFL